MNQKELTSLVLRLARGTFPDRDLTPGSTIWNKFINPLITALGPSPLDLPFRSYAQAIIRTQRPSADIEEGGEVDDLLLKPAEAILAPIVRDMTNIKQRQSIRDLRMHSVESISDIAANSGIVPSEGGYAQGIQRLYYNAPTGERVVPETYLETPSGLRYYASGMQSITASQMALNQSGDLYYFDIRIIAEKPGAVYNAEPGAISRAPTLQRVVRTANPSRLRGGLQQDTVETIASRIENFPTTQSLGTRRGTAATTLANLPFLRVLETVGMGDPDMQRDIIRGGDIDGTSVLSGSTGSTPPDEAADWNTTWFRDTGVNFVTALGVSPGAVDGYVLVATWYDSLSKNSVWRFSKVTQVVSTTTIQVGDRIFPVNLSGVFWTLCPSQLTLSDIPGGILWPDTADGEVAIQSNVVHVGGQTDAYLMGTSTEDATSDIESLTDEDLLGYGLVCQTTANSYSVVVDDLVETAIAGPLNATLVGAPGSKIYDIAAMLWGTHDMSAIHAGQVFQDPATLTQYRIKAVGKGTTAANCLRLTLDGDTGANVNPAYIMQRSPDISLRNTCFRVAEGASAGYYRCVFDMEGNYTDAPHSATEYTGCRFKVLLTHKLTNTTPDVDWFWSDDTDINLSDPKIMRADGTMLRTVAGSDVVFDVTKNFGSFGVLANDILRIDVGDDAGDHALRTDPFGAGSSYLRMSTVAKSTATVRYRIFKPLEPIQLPLLAINQIELLGADGTPLGIGLVASSTDSTSLTLPYGEPLGAYSETFTNLHRGEKALQSRCYLGIVSGGVDVTGGAPKVFNPVTTPICLWVWHPQLGRRYWSTWMGGEGDITDDRGGYIVPQIYEFKAAGPLSPYDLDTAVGWTNLIADLNALSPYPHWGFVDEDTSAAVRRRHLVCYPFGATAMLFGYKVTPTPLTFGNPCVQNASFPDDWALDVVKTSIGAVSYAYTVSSADVYSSWDLTSVVGAGVDQDFFEVVTGVNQGYSDTCCKITSNARARLMTPHAFTPDWNAQVRVGIPSTGLVRVYFKDATDFEVDSATRFTTADGTVQFLPDPTGKKLAGSPLRPLHSALIPGYGEDRNPDNGYTAAGTAPWYRSFHAKIALPAPNETNFWAEDVRPGDYLEVTRRDIVFANAAWPAAPAGNQVLTIVVGDRTVIVTFLNAVPYSRQMALDLINTAFGDEIAVSDMGDVKVRLRWQEDTTVSGSAIGAGILGAVDPVSSSNTANFYGTWKIADIRPDGASGVPSVLWVERGPSAFTLDDSLSRVQYRVLRPGLQRWSAVEMAENVGVGGLYYVDVETTGYGVGDRFNIAEDTKLTISGSRARGYRLSNTNPDLSFSMKETVWLHVDNYFQLPTVDGDSPDNDQVVFGSGFRLHYERSPIVSSAQALLNSREERDNNQSMLARHIFPYYVNCTVSYAGGALESVVLPAVENLITGRDPNEPLDVSDIVGVITGMNADHVDLPVELAVLRHQRDRSLDVLVGKDRVETPRLAGFLPGNISLVRRA